MELTPRTIPTQSEGLRYLLALFIVLLSFPISDKLANGITRITKSRTKTKYSRFLLSGFLTIAVRVLTVLMALLVGLKISGLSTVYLISGVGLLSIILPLAFTEPLRDLACGILLIAFDIIKKNLQIELDRLTGRTWRNRIKNIMSKISLSIIILLVFLLMIMGIFTALYLLPTFAIIILIVFMIQKIKDKYLI